MFTPPQGQEEEREQNRWDPRPCSSLALALVGELKPEVPENLWTLTAKPSPLLSFVSSREYRRLHAWK